MKPVRSGHRKAAPVLLALLGILVLATNSPRALRGALKDSSVTPLKPVPQSVTRSGNQPPATQPVGTPALRVTTAAAPTPATQPVETQPATGPRSAKAIERFMEYYLKLYGGHLKSPDWMARAMGTISLARIDDPRTTEKLIEAMQKDGSLIIQVYAWEALHARQDRLTAAQRSEWKGAALRLAKAGALRGDLRLGLVGLINAGGPTTWNKELFKDLFVNTNSLDPRDIRTLWAMGDMLKRWQSPDLIKGLIAAMGDLDHAYRAELVLRRVHGKIQHSSKLSRRGSKVMWTTTQQAWAQWFQGQEFKEIDPGEGGRYAGLSKTMPRGDKITNTRDPKWKKDLELRTFRLDQLDVGFAVDSTGTMGRTIRWIQRDVIKMLRAFELISREPRMGVALYRDYGDEYVVRNIPLTGNGRQLHQALRRATAQGGGDVPEALYEALLTLVKRQKWSAGSKAKKVIVIIGDAPPHEKTVDDINKFVAKSADKGFLFYTIKVRTRGQQIMRTLKRPNYDPQLATFDQIARSGNGKSFWASFIEDHHSSRSLGTAKPPSESSAERAIFREVLKAVLEEGYRDRVDPFINVLLEYVEGYVDEKRRPFGPAGRGGKGRPPRDPQAR